jgi:hypothetical protein
MAAVHVVVRRLFVACAFALAGFLGVAPADAAGLPTKGKSGWFEFSLHTAGFQIGKHRITYTHEGEDLILTYDTDVSFSIAFVTVAKFKQSIRQVWRSGKLQALDARTEEDGQVMEVRARASAKGLTVEGPSGSFMAPADTMPTFYWDPSMLGAARVLDIEKGKLIDVKFERGTEEMLSFEGRQVAAQVIRVSGEKNAEFAWTRDNEIVLRELVTHGRRIAFVREASGVEPSQAAQVSPRR